MTTREQTVSAAAVTYAIGKPAYDGNSIMYVTAVKRGGLSIDNVRIFHDRPFGMWAVRRWKNPATAERALEQLRNVGGFDDYQIFPLVD